MTGESTTEGLSPLMRSVLLGVPGALRKLPPIDGVGGAAASLAGRTLEALLGKGDGACVVEMEQARRTTAVEREWLGVAVAHRARLAVLRGEREALRRLMDLALALRLDGVGGLVVMGLRAWVALFEGRTVDAIEEAKVLGRAAGKLRWAPARIEASSLVALATAERSDALGDALKVARRGSRMARTESLPQEEYLANTVLARLRRLEGKAHLSARILSALLRVASAPWHRWMRWELWLAGVDVRSGLGAAGGGVGDLAALGEAWLFEGEVGGAETRWRRLLEVVTPCRFLLRDARVLGSLAALTESSDPEVRDFVRGASDVVPRGLSALGARLGTDAACVVSDGHRGWRVLSPARPAHARGFAEGSARQARTETAIAALLLAGRGGVEEEVLFARLYGFAYDPLRHRGVRDVLYTRIRKRSEGVAELRRDDGRVTLVHGGLLVVSDPRPSPPPELALLQVLATTEIRSASAAARVLGIPLRTAQDALRRLAEDGACQVVKRGKRCEYRVEDTTFLEPTQVAPLAPGWGVSTGS